MSNLYSGILVGYRYPTTVLPARLLLFGPLYKPFEFGQFARVPLNWKSMPGWAYVFVLMDLQAVPLLVPGDEKLCRNDPDRILSFRVDHSINGGPFYRIVDESDLSRLEYKAFAKNDWIKTETTAEAVGRPHKNLYTAVGRRNRVVQPANP